MKTEGTETENEKTAGMSLKCHWMPEGRHGRGLFAARDIKQGEWVATFGPMRPTPGRIVIEWNLVYQEQISARKHRCWCPRRRGQDGRRKDSRPHSSTIVTAIKELKR